MVHGESLEKALESFELVLTAAGAMSITHHRHEQDESGVVVLHTWGKGSRLFTKKGRKKEKNLRRKAEMPPPCLPEAFARGHP